MKMIIMIVVMKMLSTRIIKTIVMMLTKIIRMTLVNRSILKMVIMIMMMIIMKIMLIMIKRKRRRRAIIIKLKMMMFMFMVGVF